MLTALQFRPLRGRLYGGNHRTIRWQVQHNLYSQAKIRTTAPWHHVPSSFFDYSLQNDMCAALLA